MLPGLVLAALVVVAGTLSYTSWFGPFALVAVSVWWVRVNKPMEGLVLYELTLRDGITAADLAGVAGVAVAGLRLLVLVVKAVRS